MVLPDGGYLVLLPSCFHRFVERKFLEKASRGCSILGCQVEEHVMASASFLYLDGKRSWNVVHESERGIRHLEAEGNVPEPFHAIRREAEENQTREDAASSGPANVFSVDHIFEVPVRLATALTGYAHDLVALPWGRPVYDKLK
jgi:hypothetical protein